MAKSKIGFLWLSKEKKNVVSLELSQSLQRPRMQSTLNIELQPHSNVLFFLDIHIQIIRKPDIGTFIFHISMSGNHSK